MGYHRFSTFSRESQFCTGTSGVICCGALTVTECPYRSYSQEALQVNNEQTPSIHEVREWAEQMSSHGNNNESQTSSASDTVVLDYLRKKGMGGAVLELTSREDSPTTPRKVLERADEQYRNQRSILSKLTGGGFGYDRDTAWPLVHWGMPEVEGGTPVNRIGLDEANMYVDSFVTLQLHVLALSDESSNRSNTLTTDQSVAEAAALIEDDPSIEAVKVIDKVLASTGGDVFREKPNSTSEKPELMAVTFALFVHTYCELLEVGMEDSAHRLRDTFRPIYAPKYVDECQDLVDCDSTESMMRLNTHINQHLESLSNLKHLLVKIRQQELFGQELRIQATAKNIADPQQVKAVEQKLTALKQKYNEDSQKAANDFSKKHEFPFLRRVRGAKWQLTLSTQSFSLLQQICDTAMSTILQTRCELHVERRDPCNAVVPDFLVDDEIEDPTVWISGLMNSVTAADTANEEARLYLSMNIEDNNLKRNAGCDPAGPKRKPKRFDHIANALEPSILVTSLMSTSKGPFIQKRRGDTTSTDVATIWDEPGVSICCARMSPPDGARIAAGCDDSLIRIWSRDDDSAPPRILRGHQNNFPVFGVDWNMDARYLLSAGGDGAVRLWDTCTRDDHNGRNWQPECAIFRGHVPGSSIWSVTFSPSGYYFVSTGSDSSARIWTTDRPAPVRLLAGHSTSNINTAAWHPNGNYILTGADDNTARFWDVQTGRTVRLLDGCQDAIHAVDISPDGKYAALADRSGTLYVWELGSGKMLAELKAKEKTRKSFMVNSVSFSSCGRALASAGEDCCVRIWDVRDETLSALQNPGALKPFKSYTTKHTIVMDTRFTRRNLLLGVGKSVTPTPKAIAPPLVANESSSAEHIPLLPSPPKPDGGTN